MIQQITNGEGVTYHDVLIESGHNDGPQKVIGRVFSTYHPTIPYEAFCFIGRIKSHRCQTIAEGELWVIQTAATPAPDAPSVSASPSSGTPGTPTKV